jgi:glycosyltransferase involved in cell wall biosynthesis
MFVLTTAVSDDLFSYSLGQRILRKNSLVSDSVVILFLARMVKEKGLYESLEAFRLLRSRMGNVHLVMAGDGPDLHNAKEYSKSSGLAEIEFVGHIQGPAKIETFLRAHIYLLPTYGEGMPISVLEAMSMGLPVITCPVGGLKDFFENGKMGYLARTHDPVEISNLAETIIRDPSLRHRMSVFNRQYARTHFRASQVARQIEQVYSIL